jgi:lipopolysaccharide export system protein LptC
MSVSGFHVNWPPLGLALLLALLGFWLNLVSVRVETVDNAGFTHDPDFIVYHLDGLAYGMDGAPLHRLTADRMTHYMDDDTTVLDKPRYFSLDPRATGSVSSKRALISSDGNRIHFLNEVKASIDRAGEGEPITLDTEYLQVDHEARTLSTDRPVVMRQDRSIVKANKLFMDANAKLLLLEGKVRGTYERSR